MHAHLCQPNTADVNNENERVEIKNTKFKHGIIKEDIIILSSNLYEIEFLHLDFVMIKGNYEAR